MYTHMAAPQRQDPLYGWFRGWGVAVMHEPLQCSKLRKFQPWDSRHRNPQQIQKKHPKLPKFSHLLVGGGRKSATLGTVDFF